MLNCQRVYVVQSGSLHDFFREMKRKNKSENDNSENQEHQQSCIQKSMGVGILFGSKEVLCIFAEHRAKIQWFVPMLHWNCNRLVVNTY